MVHLTRFRLCRSVKRLAYARASQSRRPEGTATRELTPLRDMRQAV